MENKIDNPGVHIPPPMIYLAFFLIALLLQRKWPLDFSFFKTTLSKIIGALFILISLSFSITALAKFFKSKNTVITHKPATSLQTTGIYTISRNPMYISLSLLYAGLSLLLGNWWNFIVLPIIILIIQQYVIKNEEKYLKRKFGQAYEDYCSKVRRWL